MNKMCINDMGKDATTNNFFLITEGKPLVYFVDKVMSLSWEVQFQIHWFFFLIWSDKGEISTSGWICRTGTQGKVEDKNVDLEIHSIGRSLLRPGEWIEDLWEREYRMRKVWDQKLSCKSVGWMKKEKSEAEGKWSSLVGSHIMQNEYQSLDLIIREWFIIFGKPTQ